MNNSLNYIITSYTLHGLLLALCIYAIGCCGFHIFPVLGVSENYESINDTFLSLALSYVAGLIIFGLTSVIPRRQRQKEVFEIWKPHLSRLYNDMSERIEEVRAFVGIPKEKMESLTAADCEPLARYTDLPSEVWIHRSYGRKSGISEPFSIKKRLNGHHKTVHHIIDIMLKNPMAIDAEKKILDILSQINSSGFLAYCNSIMDSSCLCNPPISINNSHLKEPFCEYVKLRDKLGALSINKSIYEVRVLTDDETKECKKNRQELVERQGFTMEQINAYGQQIANASMSIK